MKTTLSFSTATACVKMAAVVLLMATLVAFLVLRSLSHLVHHSHSHYLHYHNNSSNDVSSPLSHASVVTLLLACNRPAVKRALDSILTYKPNHMPLVVSLDCAHSPTRDVIVAYANNITLIEQPDRSEPSVRPGHNHLVNYYKVSRHYKWALKTVFDSFPAATQLIILEDDMEIAPDFFHYFSYFGRLLNHDPSLYCISSWNDNGKVGMVFDENEFYRTDFFPGLGWSMSRSLWSELESKWPAAFWDDWLREPEQRKGRQCIIPEISRTKNFGKEGVSVGMFFDDHISKIAMADTPADFHQLDLDDFEKEAYATRMMKRVYELSSNISSSQLKLLLNSPDEFMNADSYRSNRNLPKNNRPFGPFSHNSLHYCGDKCWRRFVIFYPLPADQQLEQVLRANLLPLYHDWQLLDDIRASVARCTYKNIAVTKRRVTFSNGKEEVVLVYFAPSI